MERFLVYHRRMFLISLAISVAAAVALALVLPGDWARLGGFVVGAAAQLFKFGFFDVATIQKMAAQPDRAPGIQLRSTVLSLILFGAAVAVVFWCRFDVWTMAMGIFLPRLILLVDTYIRPNPFGGDPSRNQTDKQ